MADCNFAKGIEAAAEVIASFESYEGLEMFRQLDAITHDASTCRECNVLAAAEGWLDGTAQRRILRVERRLAEAVVDRRESRS